MEEEKEEEANNRKNTATIESQSNNEMAFEEEDDIEELETHLEIFLQDIRQKVMREFKLNEQKWG